LREHDPESRDATLSAQLVFSSDCSPGFRRTGLEGGGFAYSHDTGRTIGEDELERIAQLKVPPAWSDVWICDDERGHLQATGRDRKGRKQYRYHERWRAVRDENKYGRLVEFGEALPAIRERVDRDLRRSTLDRRRVLALTVAVLDQTLVRVGNERYLRQNASYGLTTLRDEHVEVGTARVRLRFRGKSGKELDVDIDSPRIARALRRTRDLPGEELLQYVDEKGEQHVVESDDVNAYLREAAGAAFTSKDFRTWGGSLTAALVLHALAASPATERAVTNAVREAAAVLHNTPAVCRRSYIHPGLLELYRAGQFESAWHDAEASEPAHPHMSEDERGFLGVLRRLRDAAHNDLPGRADESR
jgi:DNA topoisomerase-1